MTVQFVELLDDEHGKHGKLVAFPFQLASHIGIHFTHLSKIENGKDLRRFRPPPKTSARRRKTAEKETPPARAYNLLKADSTNVKFPATQVTPS